MKDRVSTEVLSNGALRYAEYDENGVFQQYRYLILDDDPTEVGTPLNAALFNYFNAAVGTTAGTSANYTLAGDGGFSLADGATVRFKLHTDTASGATLDVNSTGALPMILSTGVALPAGIKAGTWLTATYSASANSFIVNFATVTAESITSDGISFTVYAIGNVFMAKGIISSYTPADPGGAAPGANGIDLSGFGAKYKVLFGAVGGRNSSGRYKGSVFAGVTTSPYKIYFVNYGNDLSNLYNADITLFGITA